PGDDFAYVPQSSSASTSTRKAAPSTARETQVLPAQDVAQEDRSAQPMRIREVRHWEDDEPPQREDFGKEWGQTWPTSRKQGPALPWQQQPPPKQPSLSRVFGSPRRESAGMDRRDVLRGFVKDDEGVQSS